MAVIEPLDASFCETLVIVLVMWRLQSPTHASRTSLQASCQFRVHTGLIQLPLHHNHVAFEKFNIAQSRNGAL